MAARSLGALLGKTLAMSGQTWHHDVQLLDHDLKTERIAQEFLGGNPRVCLTNHEYPFVFHSGRTLRVCDRNFGLVQELNYPREVVSASAIDHGGDLYWGLGFEDGTLLLERFNGKNGKVESSEPWSISSRPVGLLLRHFGESVDLWAIGNDSRIHRASNVVATFGQQRSLIPKEVPFGNTRNVLACAPVVSVDRGFGFVLLSPWGFCVINPSEDYVSEDHVSIVPICNRTPTCLTLKRDCESEMMEVIVGTREQSLLFMSLAGKLLSEAYLADVPTVIHAKGG